MPETKIPSIHLKDIPQNVFDLIIDKQTNERKKKGTKIHLGYAVIMLLKEAYLKKENNGKSKVG